MKNNNIFCYFHLQILSYVYPLPFINDKHIVGEVKEKETAHKEYKKAISEGHGSYLMDQDEETPVCIIYEKGGVTQYTYRKQCFVLF
jgi:hypothetical protein